MPGTGSQLLLEATPVKAMVTKASDSVPDGPVVVASSPRANMGSLTLALGAGADASDVLPILRSALVRDLDGLFGLGLPERLEVTVTVTAQSGEVAMARATVTFTGT